MRPFLKFLVLPAVLAALTFPSPAQAQTINLLIQAQEILQGGSGTTAAQPGSLVLLVADTSGAGFSPLQAGAISVGSMIDAGANDLVIDQLAISQGNFLFNNEPILVAQINNISFFGAWDANDPLAIYWIPSLATGASNVAPDVAYGKYTDQVGLDGSAAWITPATGQGAPMFFTTDGNGIGNGTTVPASTGYSTLTTTPVPEPSVYALFGGLLSLAIASWRRRKIA